MREILDTNKENIDSVAKPNAGVSDPTDGRKLHEWETRYPSDARKKILLETIYLFVMFFASFFLIFANWKGWLGVLLSLSIDDTLTLKKYVYYASSGMLGGIVFGMKYFYRVVARGYWNQDRIIWRTMSPFIAMAVSFIVGMMIDASFLAAKQPITSAAILSIGFLAGYFADEAVGKMYEVACVIFGKSSSTKAGDGK